MKSKAILLLLPVIASGCANSGRAGADFCAIAKPIYMHPQDDLTDSTVDQIVAFDMLGQRICGWRPPGR